MKNKRRAGYLFYIASAFLVCIIASCSTPVERKPLLCPPPPQPECKPGTFDKVLLDTTFHGPGKLQNHITALPEPVNSAANDNQITFVPTEHGYIALISSDRASAAPDTTERPVQRLYAAKFIRTTEYGDIRAVIEDVDLHQVLGAGFYSQADGRFYFSAKAANADPDDYDLYSARLEFPASSNVLMMDVQPLTAINSVNNFDSQPTLSADGKRIYFVSDRPGGHGCTDIWTAERASINTQNWSDPTPLPAPINTECDELSPYISSTDPTTFYFASNGHETVGGYDLFKSHISGEEFSGPENLGKPINTQYDEIFPVALNDTAFFWSSNMPADEAGRNLYTIRRTRLNQPEAHGRVAAERPDISQLHEDTTGPGPVEIIAHVTRGANDRPAVGSDIYVRKDSVELYRGIIPPSGVMGFKVNRGAEYDVGAETEDAFFDVRHVDLHGYKDSTYEIDLHLPDTLVLRINFPFDDYEHPYENVIDENGQASSMTWQQALDLTAHSALRSLSRLRELILIGHTDSLGTDAYNERLGFRRATFVAEELEKRGVPKSIIRVVSKGREQPVAKRPGESDELFRLRSRRVEFIKVFQ